MCVIASGALTAYLANKGRKILQTLNEHEKPLMMKVLKDMSGLKIREKNGEDVSEEMAICERTLSRLKDSATIASIKEMTSDLADFAEVGEGKLNEYIDNTIKE